RLAAAECCLPSDVKREILRVVNHIRTRRESRGVGRIEVEENIEGFSAVYRGYSGNLPTPKNGLRYTVGLTSKVPPFAIRQIVDIAHNQLVAEVRSGRAFFCGNVMSVLDVALVLVAVCGAQ